MLSSRDACHLIFINEYVISTHDQCIVTMQRHFTLQQLINMRTKPYLWGLIGRMHDVRFNNNKHSESHELELQRDNLDFDDTIKMAMSLLYYCTDIHLRVFAARQSFEYDKYTRARLLLILTMYHKNTRFTLAIIIITHCYGVSIYKGMSNPCVPVWKWQEYPVDMPTLEGQIRRIHDVMYTGAQKDIARCKKRKVCAYSSETMRRFLRSYGGSGFTELTVSEYISKRNEYLPIAAQALVCERRKCRKCVECAIAEEVQRKCTVHGWRKNKSNVDAYHAPMAAVAAATAYTVPPAASVAPPPSPSAPPMETFE